MRDLRLLQSAHIEEIVSSSFQVIYGTKPKQKVQLLESNMEVLKKMGNYTGITFECAIPMDSNNYVPISKRALVTAQVVIGTPGTINKWATTKKLSTNYLKILVFDEANHMLAEISLIPSCFDDELVVHVSDCGLAPLISSISESQGNLVLWKGPSRWHKPVDWVQIERKRHDKERTLEEHKKLVGEILKRDQKKRKKIEAAGIDYECPEIDDVLDVPWRVKLLLPSIAALPLLMAYAGHPTIVLVAGGGDGGVLREISRHNTII
ncbi:unnamed protein product [Camellia sinensis]